MKKKIIIVLLLIILIIFIKNRIENKTFYEFKSLIKNEFNYVHNVSVSDMGPYCIIDIYLKRDNYEFDKIEPLFVYIMNQATGEPYFSYFANHHVKKASGEFYYFSAAFRKQGDNNKELCRFNTSKRENFKNWSLDGTANQNYYVYD